MLLCKSWRTITLIYLLMLSSIHAIINMRATILSQLLAWRHIIVNNICWITHNPTSSANPTLSAVSNRYTRNNIHACYHITYIARMLPYYCKQSLLIEVNPIIPSPILYFYCSIGCHTDINILSITLVLSYIITFLGALWSSTHVISYVDVE
jgi:hypothetical protein